MKKTIRLKSPRTNAGREMAESIWKRRNEIAIRPDRSNPSHADADVTPSLLIQVHDDIDKQLAMKTRSGTGNEGQFYIRIPDTIQSWHVSQDEGRWIGHAWRSVLVSRFLGALGLDDDPGTAALCRVVKERSNFWTNVVHPIAEFVAGHKPVIWEVLEERLDAEVARRIQGIPLDSPTTYTMDIGGGVTIDAAVCEPILALTHPDFGRLTLPGRSAKIFNARADMIRERMRRALPASTGIDTARISRLLHICQEAIAIDPEMRDARGTPILPLLEKHLPRLAEQHTRALALSSPEERAAIDDDLENTLALVASAVEEGMTNEARLRRDALRTELHFLRMRHQL